MCGIAGIFRFTDAAGSDANADGRLERMRSYLVPRGPDQRGTWISSDRRVQFVHTRLSIIDLSDAGRQPFHSATALTTIVFNGEIYNYRSLADDLKSRGWTPRSGSDTEVLVELLERDGAEKTLPRLDGMFAFAAYCHRTRTLTLARDAFGEKPLYFSLVRSSLAFSSDPRSIRAFTASPLSLDYSALRDYLYWGYLPKSTSPWIGVEKLRPGTWISVRDRSNGDFELTRHQHYSPAARARASQLARSEALHDAAFDDMIGEVVRSRLVADVPVGALLSGGVDSSLVAAHASRSPAGLSTFTIGFTDGLLNEAPFARRVAAHLGTDHHEWYLTEREAQSSFDDLIRLLGEPLGDSSLLPTYLVSRLASEHVKVVLSGDGGDEMFAGYTRYLRLGTIVRVQHAVPRSVRASLAARMLMNPRVAAWLASTQQLPLPPALRVDDIGPKMARLAAVLGAEDAAAAYREMTTAAADHFCARSENVDQTRIGDDWLGDALLHDVTHYLPDDLCTKVDRASMACGLEVRAPFLSQRVFDEAWRYPRSALIRHGHGKWPLRRALASHVPPELTDRPKMGFGIPIHQWLRTGLREQIVAATTDTASRQHLEAAGSDLEKLDGVVRAHLAGTANHGYELWNVLILSRWLAANV